MLVAFHIFIFAHIVYHVSGGDRMRTAIIGGDERMIYAAEGFLRDGAEVRMSCFERSDYTGIECIDPKTAASWADIIILPVVPVNNGCLNAPLSGQKIGVQELAEYISSKPVFTGRANLLKEFTNGRLFDYTAREGFSVRNAVLTAEGALGVVISEYSDSLFNADVLVTGFGRIGRVTARYLRAMGARVTVAVRSESAAAWAEAEGYKTCGYSPEELSRYSLVINTVPALIITSYIIDLMSADTLIIDLASMPGGVDDDCAHDGGVRCIHALALPARTAPVAAGRIIKETICSMIKEEIGGKENDWLRDDRLLLHLR